MGDITNESITQKYLDDRLKAFESKTMDKIHDLISKEFVRKKTYTKEEDDGPDPRPASRDYLRSEIRGLKAEVLMWMIGMFIAFCSLIFWVMNNSHNALDYKITAIESSLKADIAENKGLIQENKTLVQENKALIQENKVLIQKVLENQNR